jgi:starch-binding outer membrane protein, SusD/RagB family
MKIILKQTTLAVLVMATILFNGCTKKLDLSPTNDITSVSVFATPTGYRQALAKAYSSMATTGNSGSTSGDLPTEIVIDAGSSDFNRNYWYLQCLSTDEAGWTYADKFDPIGIHQMSWSSATFAVKCLYYRMFYTITLCNNFITESSDEKLATRGISGKDADDIKLYQQEARFLRAYNYWAMMDLFGNPPFVTETTQIGAVSLPPQTSRAALFAYLESELKSLETTLAAPKTNEYGRMDKAAAWSLLSRMYLNAKVYTGTPRYTDAITYCNKVIASGYTLHSKYKELMLADNNLNTDEFIWSLNYDGRSTQSYGGTTFLVHGPSGYTSDSSGLNGSWNCIRMTQQFVGLFDNNDIRGQFWTGGQNLNMTTLLGTATDGYSSSKFRNKTRTGAPAPHLDNTLPSNSNFSDIDMPVFRLAEIYLTYAESVLRGGTGGSNTTALGYLQQLAVRARPTDANAANYPSLTLPYILTERGRELFWEGFRRTDLIRYDQFTTGTYIWAWKGGVASGTAVDAKYNLYPIPSEDLSSNPNLQQNPGY